MERNRKIEKKKHRRKSSTRTSLSEPDLTTADKQRYNSGFPLGTTVDELFHYRRKQPPAFVRLQDNLKAEEGSYQYIKSEYKRRFRNDAYQKIQEVPRAKSRRPEDSLKVEGSLELKPEYYESFIEYPIEKSIVLRPKNLINGIGMEIVDEEEKTDDEQEEDKSSEQRPQFRSRRHYLHPTNFQLGGDFHSETENAEQFVHYLLTGRPDLARKATTLKLEGEMETKTESNENYVLFEHQSRPPLFKKSTNLHLEGILDITTETREKYLPYEVQQRAPLTKRSTNLHLEGDLNLQPEYKDVFVEHKGAERQRPTMPSNNLKTEGCFESQTEKSEKFVIHPIIPFLRGGDISVSNRRLMLGDDAVVKRPEYREKFVEHTKIDRSFQLKPQANLKPEGCMETITENKTQFVQKPVSRTEMRKAANNLLLEGNIDMNPEYRNAYVNFYRDAYGKFGVKKDENEPERRRRRTVSHPATNLKSEGEMETNPEYKSSFVDFPRHRPSMKKPQNHLRSEGNLSHMTEKRAQYIEHPKGSKAKPLKRQTELKLEGPFECQPEYRRAYIDYITREKGDRPRPSDNLAVQSKRVFDTPEEIIQTPLPSPVPPPILEEKDDENATVTSEPTDGSTTLPEQAKIKLPIPVASRKSSLSPASRTSERRAKEENLSKMENCLFGPKVPNPSGRRRNISPANEQSRKTIEERARAARARRRYGSPVMVENLAYTPRTSPVQAILKASAKNRWKHEDDRKDGRAFVVISSLDDDCRNKCSSSNDSTHYDRNPTRHSELHKEQKWMPSWYAPPRNKQ